MILYLHAGTHKTGTTFIQRFINEHRELIEGRGLYWPKSGLVGAEPELAHHNIAWELGGHRTDPNAGGLEALISELRERAPATACVSSEMFSTLYEKPESLERLRAAAESIGASVRPILYFRPQSDYLEALYAELVKHGLTRSFGDFLEEIIDRGTIDYNEAKYAFTYDLVAAAFESAFGHEAMTVLPYDNRGPSERILKEFLTIVCPAASDLDLVKLGAWERVNVSIGFRGVAGNLADNRAREGEAMPFETILDELMRDGTWTPDELLKPNGLYWSGAFRPLDVDDLARLLARFQEGNNRLDISYHVAVPVYRVTRLFDEVRARSANRQAWDPAR